MNATFRFYYVIDFVNRKAFREVIFETVNRTASSYTQGLLAEYSIEY